MVISKKDFLLPINCEAVMYSLLPHCKARTKLSYLTQFLDLEAHGVRATAKSSHDRLSCRAIYSVIIAGLDPTPE